MSRGNPCLKPNCFVFVKLLFGSAGVVCKCEGMYACMYLCVCTCVCMHMCMHACMHACMHVCVCVRACESVYACYYAWMCVCICASVHACAEGIYVCVCGCMRAQYVRFCANVELRARARVCVCVSCRLCVYAHVFTSACAPVYVCVCQEFYNNQFCCYASPDLPRLTA